MQFTLISHAYWEGLCWKILYPFKLATLFIARYMQSIQWHLGLLFCFGRFEQYPRREKFQVITSVYSSIITWSLKYHTHLDKRWCQFINIQRTFSSYSNSVNIIEKGCIILFAVWYMYSVYSKWIEWIEIVSKHEKLYYFFQVPKSSATRCTTIIVNLVIVFSVISQLSFEAKHQNKIPRYCPNTTCHIPASHL